MDTVHNFALKQRKYMPIFPKASGKPTIYIEGYPCEDDEPMAATGFHGVQINAFYDQLSRYFAINDQIYIGVDSFIYYSEGDITKSVAQIFTLSSVLIKPLNVAVSIRGQRGQCLLLFLSSSLIQRHIRIGIEKLRCI